jgi:hypothetical protein
MKHGGAMDGAFSHSPQAVRDHVKAEAAHTESEHPPAETSAGLWSAPQAQV